MVAKYHSTDSDDTALGNYGNGEPIWETAQEIHKSETRTLQETGTSGGTTYGRETSTSMGENVGREKMRHREHCGQEVVKDILPGGGGSGGRCKAVSSVVIRFTELRTEGQ